MKLQSTIQLLIDNQNNPSCTHIVLPAGKVAEADIERFLHYLKENKVVTDIQADEEQFKSREHQKCLITCLERNRSLASDYGRAQVYLQEVQKLIRNPQSDISKEECARKISDYHQRIKVISERLQQEKHPLAVNLVKQLMISQQSMNPFLLLHLPPEMLSHVLSYLNPKELSQVASVSRYLYDTANDNRLWKQFLKTPLAEGSSAKSSFIENPSNRKLYIAIDEKGRTYLKQQIHRALRQRGLTKIQKAHLSSQLVRTQILEGQLTVKAAYERVSREKTTGLKREQLRGVKAGLTCEQVNHVWFKRRHARAVKSGMPYKVCQGLTSHQVSVISKGFSRKQVIGLSHYQLDGLVAGLTREQVNHSWFSWGHAHAAYVRRPYESYQELTNHAADALAHDKRLTREQVIGLNRYQLDGLRVGLTREQVDHKWFGSGHALAAKLGKPYKRFRRLTSKQASAIAGGASRQQVRGLSSDQLRRLEARGT